MAYPKALQSLWNDWRLSAFVFAILLYAIGGSPTPNNPGVLELIIAGLLIAAIGITPFFNSLKISVTERMAHGSHLWQLFGRVLFLYTGVVGLIFALMNGASAHLILRDVIGLVFLCLPLFVFGFFKQNEHREKLFPYLITAIGIGFSARVLLPVLPFMGGNDKLLYLANSPLVLLTALMLVSIAAQKIFVHFNVKNMAYFACLMLLASIPILAMFVDIQRASFISLIMSAAFLGVLGFIKAPLKTVLPACFIIMLGWFFYPSLFEIVQNISLKTSRVGLNMRYQEFLAVWDMVCVSWGTLFFGYGWGASFASPAVGDLQVTFTHSLLTYMLFKTGLIGLGLTVVYLLFLFEKLAQVVLINPIKGNAIFWPFIIPILFYASYKSFDFGLVLTFVVLSASTLLNKPVLNKKEL